MNTRFGALPALQWGDPNGEIILASHGWLDNAASFERLAPFLKHYNLLCIDLPGHGLAPWLPPEADYHIWTPVEAVAEIARSFDQKVHLLGHSMGGAVSLLTAASIPEKVASVISIDVFGPLTQSTEDTVANFRQAIVPTKQKSPRIFNRLGEAVHARAQAGHQPEEVVRPIVLRNLQQVPDGWRWRTDPRLRLRSRFRFTPEILASFLKSIECPVLVIKANQGYLSQSIIDERLPLVPNAMAINVEGHHHCHLDADQVGSVAEAIGGFYQDSGVMA